jgi:cellobiose phosphorylase
VTRRYRNSVYKIQILNPNGVCKGVVSTFIDGIRSGSNLLPAYNDGKEHDVIVTMGKK